MHRWGRYVVAIGLGLCVAAGDALAACTLETLFDKDTRMTALIKALEARDPARATVVKAKYEEFQKRVLSSGAVQEADCPAMDALMEEAAG